MTAAGFYLPPGADTIDSESTVLTKVLLENKRLKQLLRAALCLVAIFQQLLSEFALKAERFSGVRQALERLMT